MCVFFEVHFHWLATLSVPSLLHALSLAGSPRYEDPNTCFDGREHAGIKHSTSFQTRSQYEHSKRRAEENTKKRMQRENAQYVYFGLHFDTWVYIGFAFGSVLIGATSYYVFFVHGDKGKQTFH